MATITTAPGTDVATLQGLDVVFQNVIQVAIGFAAIVFFILFMVGGINFITAGGEPGKVEGAKKMLTYAIAGLLLVILSYLILVLIANFTGAQGILNFKIYQPK